MYRTRQGLIDALGSERAYLARLEREQSAMSAAGGSPAVAGILAPIIDRTRQKIAHLEHQLAELD